MFIVMFNVNSFYFCRVWLRWLKQNLRNEIWRRLRLKLKLFLALFRPKIQTGGTIFVINFSLALKTETFVILTSREKLFPEIQQLCLWQQKTFRRPLFRFIAQWKFTWNFVLHKKYLWLHAKAFWKLICIWIEFYFTLLPWCCTLRRNSNQWTSRAHLGKINFHFKSSITSTQNSREI